MKMDLITFLMVIFVTCGQSNLNKEAEIPLEIKSNNSHYIYKRVNIDVGKLRIRELSAIDSKIIGTLNNGEEVTVVEESNEIIEIDGKRGKWTKINYSDKTGWVFGSYLRDFLKASENTITPSCYDIDKILTKKYGIVGRRKNLKADSSKDETQKYVENYKNGIELKFVANYGAQVFNIKFKNHTLKEVFELLSECDSRIKHDLFLPENEQLQIEFNSCDEPCSGFYESFKLKKENNEIKLFFFGTT